MYDEFTELITEDETAEILSMLENGDKPFENLPTGNYIARIVSFNEGVSKTKGTHTVYVRFKVLEGEQEGRMGFLQFSIDGTYKPFKYKKFCDFTRSLKTNVDLSGSRVINPDTKLFDYELVAQMVNEVFADISDRKLEYEIAFYKGDSGAVLNGKPVKFDTGEIVQVFEQ